MNEIRVLFGKPATQDSARLISALKDLQSRYGCVAQALDADLIVSERQVIFAAEKALAAFSEGRNIAKDMGMEIMRYASGERQIERAFVIGITDRTRRIALVLVNSGEESSWPESLDLSGVIELDGRGYAFDAAAVIEVFHITAAELVAVGEEKIEDLVLERVALADTYR